MSITLGVVGVPPLAGHPPAIRRFGNCSLLEWVIRRVTEAQLLEHVAVLFHDAAAHRAAASLVPPHVSVIGHDQPDPLARLTAEVRETGADGVVHVDVNQPFIDPEFVDRLVSTAVQVRGVDYISYCRSDGRTALLSQIGLLGQWCSAAAITRADQEATWPRERQDPLEFVRGHPELFPMRLIPVPTALDREDLRLVIDREEDWERAETIVDALGPDRLDWQRITTLLDQQPEMCRQMELLNRSRS